MTKNINKLKTLIESGVSPIIAETKYGDDWNMGDLKALGWATFRRDRSGSMLEEYWIYHGPNTIVCNGIQMSRGDETEKYIEDH